MKPAAIASAEDLLSLRATDWTRVERGYTQHERWRVSFDEGRTAFVKAATDDASAEWLRVELGVYANVRGAFLPRLLAHGDGLLVLEDLTEAEWPPPWSTSAIDAVLVGLGEIAATSPPQDLIRLEAQRERFDGWRDIAADPEPFLSLGLCSRRWLALALPDFLAASRAAWLEGSALVHCDVRSDNLCLREGRAVFIDWNQASVGNPLFDLVCWLPSLAMEGGPQPEEVAGDHEGVAEMAALVASYFAARAGLPPIPAAPGVRDLQRAQLEVALPWAVRALRLPELDQ